ncbi:DUF4350 domain-containing protein [Streptomyces tubbatahanensis]|uniref:DUF4350 domain-containing protein n=1 Tax=Streptomyces tubbatahanensis TaxID=2923272 RepID=A0ABY3XSA9_9ACTN|nr:DUF4350 domain-containing protein [Streptomyces tubbatahanensis]UNS97348.1 DUF4350 domain-containing protein [Streptomyces tubbatahanensis]
MTVTAPTSTSPTARHLWRRARGLLLAAAIIAVTAVVLAALRSGDENGALDPRSTAPYGSKAVSRLLSDHGVRTKVLTDPAQLRTSVGPDTTVVVPFPDSLGDDRRTVLRTATRRSGRTVLLAPNPQTTAALTQGVRTAAPTQVRTTAPACGLPAAHRAGDADLGGFRYSTDAKTADSCYLHDGKATLLRVPRSDPAGPGTAGDTVLLGSPAPLYNKHLDEHGNASLSLQVLGAHSQLLWYLPATTDAGPAPSEERGFLDLLPSGWSWAALQLAIAAAFAALWRARRLGPLVTEQLPVHVPAAEATEGRARLYRRANARGHAADALRAATRTRLAPRIGVPLAEAHRSESMLPALADQTAGAADTDGTRIQPDALRSLLFGPPPRDDAALIALADDLDRLERRVLGHTGPDTPSTDKDVRS